MTSDEGAYNAIEAAYREYLTRIEQIYKEYAEKAKLCWVDIYKSDRLVCKFGCEKTPCVVFLKDGNVVKREYDISNIKSAFTEILNG